MGRFAALLALIGWVNVAPVVADGSPVVVELYTSQGCSSCPPADALLQDLAKMENVIALALHVDYWDYIGWRDSFADPAYSRRQHGYARAANARMVYTPQMIIDGQTHVVGSRVMEVMAAVRARDSQEKPVSLRLRRDGGALNIQAQSSAAGDFVVQLVRYQPAARVEIRQGENAGNTFTYSHIVHDWRVIGGWDGRSELVASVPLAGDSPAVVIVQESGFGRILGAAKIN